MEKESDFLILEIPPAAESGSDPVVFGNTALKDQLLNPASTIKLALALSLIQNGYDPGRRILVNDPYIDGTPRRIDLSQALLYSSNDYFRSLAAETGAEGFRQSITDMRFYPEAPAPDWPGRIEDIVHGGGGKTTALHQLRFMERILKGQVQGAETLLSLIQWPRTEQDMERHEDLHLYGKTGSFDRTVWFLGGARMGDEVRTIVIVRRGHWKLRIQAIELFYCRMGQSVPDHPLIR